MVADIVDLRHGNEVLRLSVAGDEAVGGDGKLSRQLVWLRRLIKFAYNHDIHVL
jgi:hypothetical protein